MQMNFWFSVYLGLFSYMNGEKKYKLEILDNIDGSVSLPLFKEENYYLPIALSRTSSNPNLVENPGYK